MKARWEIFAAAALFLAAAFFAFALVGYRVLALCLAALGVFFLLEWRCARTGRKKLRLGLWGLLALALIGLGLLCLPVLREARTDADPEADYVIVLGAGVNGTVPSLSLTDRLTAALIYLNTYPEARAVLSGGQGPREDITEAACMYAWLTERSVSPERLILEEVATTTEENLRFSLEHIRAEGGNTERVAILSSEYHLYRAKALAREAGIPDPVGVAARTSLPLLRLNYFLREAGGVALGLFA